MKENLKGRIENLAMSPSYSNTLIPVLEAIMNSLHAVQDRFGEDWAEKGSIQVTVHQGQDGNPHSFSITDNGIGLDDENFESFRTYDSRLKIKKGGKGVGRLTWLKVFGEIKISSVFRDGRTDSLRTRTFDFVLDNENAIQNHGLSDHGETTDQGTSVELKMLKNGYRLLCPKKLETISHRIAAYFLLSLIGDDCPDISVTDGKESLELRDIIRRHTHNQTHDSFEVEGKGRFSINHLLLAKSLTDKGIGHTIYLAANDRIVTSHDVHNQTGLDGPFMHREDQVTYVGIISSDFLDENVTQERNNFDISREDLKAIMHEAEGYAKAYLSKPIEDLIKTKAETISRVITNFPRYAYLVGDRKEFAEKLPLNSKSEEDIYREMSVHDYRATREIANKLSALMSEDPEMPSGESFTDGLDALMERVGEQERASLADYVGKRKLIIEILDDHLGFSGENGSKMHTEDMIHRIICPMRVSSGDIRYDNHNLWLIDDRLAYYEFWASDEKIRKFASSSECEARPDLVLFQGSNLMRRPGTSQPAVIVEFKRPARDDYADGGNPLNQIYNYIEELRGNRIHDNKGKLITEIGEETPFFCYLVCDITPSLLRVLENYGISQKLPGGRGFFGFNQSRKAYVEVLQYGQLVADARLRHEAFFRKLGIN